MPEPRWTTPSPDADAIADAYEQLTAAARAGERRFERSFQTHLHAVEDGWISVTELDDDFHSMRIALRVDTEGTVTEAAGRMLKHPFDTCPRAMSALAGLIGASVWRRNQEQLKQRIPRDEGCLHVADMLAIAFRSFRISLGHEMPDWEGQDGRRAIIELLPNVRDTCVSFAVRSD
ncbi:MAG TPA: DUF2889 domain-containing protein [Actinomycetota bacterium]